LLIAKLMVPGEASAEGEEPDAGSQGLKFESSIDAIIKGTMDGMQLFLAVIAVIIVVFALVSL
ncbi:MAG TPA: nucleoside:proton symporter, partial [Erythrobacter sp.]|nr:nucleoside:proton symporter [Erythrobacter sp.]